MLMQAGSARHAGDTSAIDYHAMTVNIAGQFRYQEKNHVSDLFRFGDPCRAQKLNLLRLSCKPIHMMQPTQH